jgi:cysteine-rich repeat protein
MLASRLSPLLLGAAALTGCFVDNYQGTTDGTTTSTTTGESETETCPAGVDGCPCLPGNACDDGLACLDGMCSGAGTCGDGAVDVGEECDDGDDNDDDACLTTCVLATCGDGFVHVGVEECDDANPVDGDGCNADCRLSGAIEWTLAFEGEPPGADVGHAVAIEPSGQIAVAGVIRTAQSADIWVARLTVGGEVIWTQTFDGGAKQADEAWAVSFTGDGDVVVAGYRTEIFENNPDVDAWVARLDGATGDTRWSSLIKGTSPNGADQLRGVVVDDDGTIVVAGWLHNDGTGKDALLRRYTAAGEEIWTTLTDGGAMADDRAFALVRGGDNNLVYCGQRSDGMQVDAHIATVSSNGAPVWGKTFDGGTLANKEIAYGCASNQIGTVYAIVTETKGADDDYWYLTYNALGELTVNQRLGGTDAHERGRAIALSGDGTLVLVGADSEEGEGTNLMIRKQDSSTALLWKIGVKGVGMANDLGHGVAIGPTGEVVVTGQVASVGADDFGLWVGKITP